MCDKLLLIAVLSLSASLGSAAPVASNLKAEYRSGQVFLTWDEAQSWPGSFNIRVASQPITAATVGQSKVLAGHIAPGSACDWWLNPETSGNPLKKDPVTGQKPPIPHEGFIIRQGAPRLPPDSGLFVHTVTPDEVGPRYYAVTAVDKTGTEQCEIIAGVNSLAQPVEQKCEPIEPIWQESDPPPTPASTRNPRLVLILHARGGVGKTRMQYLAFGDATLGWREGLPFKFGVYVGDNTVLVIPVDRTWIDRMFPEGDDCQKLTPAIHSFWYGYNSHINDPARMKDGIATNYTERRLLWIIAWAKRFFHTDPNRTYVFGTSLGGCGSISFALRHPEIFAGIRAHVPIVAFDKGPGGDTEWRLTAECGPLDRVCSDGIPLRERMDGTRFVRGAKGDLPYLVISHARQDTSIPWWKNPDFYRALRDGRHGFIAAWDNGTHASCMQDAPPDIKRWDELPWESPAEQKLWDKLSVFDQIALNKSYPAFSNSSADQNPGNGSKTDGDLVGYMNRGLSWSEPVDEARRYEVVVKWDLDAALLPVTVDVTPRRLQAFKLKPNQKVQALNIQADNDKEVQRKMLVADDASLVTFDRFQVTSPAGNKLILTRPD